MIRTLIIVGLGGAAGSILRWLVSFLAEKIWGTGFPWGTFLVNFTGCLIIGLFIQYTDRTAGTVELRLLMATGFCGGFTTFSAFAFENVKMIEAGNYQGFFIYSLGSVAAGIFGVFAGMRLP